jgi:hypothetical protein
MHGTVSRCLSCAGRNSQPALATQHLGPDVTVKRRLGCNVPKRHQRSRICSHTGGATLIPGSSRGLGDEAHNSQDAAHASPTCTLGDSRQDFSLFLMLPNLEYAHAYSKSKPGNTPRSKARTFLTGGSRYSPYIHSLLQTGSESEQGPHAGAKRYRDTSFPPRSSRQDP